MKALLRLYGFTKMVDFPHPTTTLRVPIREHMRAFGIDNFQAPSFSPYREFEFTYVRHVRIMDEDVAVFDGEIL